MSLDDHQCAQVGDQKMRDLLAIYHAHHLSDGINGTWHSRDDRPAIDIEIGRACLYTQQTQWNYRTPDGALQHRKTSVVGILKLAYRLKSDRQLPDEAGTLRIGEHKFEVQAPSRIRDYRVCQPQEWEGYIVELFNLRVHTQ